jgi:hypothetical protein
MLGGFRHVKQTGSFALSLAVILHFCRSRGMRFSGSLRCYPPPRVRLHCWSDAALRAPPFTPSSRDGIVCVRCNLGTSASLLARRAFQTTTRVRCLGSLFRSASSSLRARWKKRGRCIHGVCAFVPGTSTQQVDAWTPIIALRLIVKPAALVSRT